MQCKLYISINETLKILITLLGFIHLSMFSYSPIKTKYSYNQRVIEEVLSRMVEGENNNSADDF